MAMYIDNLFVLARRFGRGVHLRAVKFALWRESHVCLIYQYVMQVSTYCMFSV